MKILLFGGDNGFKNAGDQAMLVEVARRLRNIFPDPEIIVLAANPKDVIRVPNAKYVHMLDRLYGFNLPMIFSNLISKYRCKPLRIMFSLFAKMYIVILCIIERYGLRLPFFTLKQKKFICCIKNVDLILNYGSGGINDIWGEYTILQWSLIYNLAAIYSIPVIITGQGIGPIKNKLYARVLKKSINSYVAFITLREKLFSANYLRKIGVRKEIIYETADDAISLPISKGINEVLKKERIDSKERKIGIHIRSTNYTRNYDIREKKSFAQFLDRLGNELSGKVVFVPMCYYPIVDDRIIAEEISEMMLYHNFVNIRKEYEPSILKGIIGSMDINIGFSYHFILFSLSCGVPTMTFYTNDYYSMKMKGLTTLFKQQECVSKYSSENTEQYIQYAKKLLKHKLVIKENLLTCKNQLEYEVSRSFERIKPLIKV